MIYRYLSSFHTFKNVVSIPNISSMSFRKYSHTTILLLYISLNVVHSVFYSFKIVQTTFAQSSKIISNSSLHFFLNAGSFAGVAGTLCGWLMESRALQSNFWNFQVDHSNLWESSKVWDMYLTGLHHAPIYFILVLSCYL